MIIDNDNDVVVLIISFFSEIVAEKLWVTLEKGQEETIHNICSAKSSAKIIIIKNMGGNYSWFSCSDRAWQHILFSGTGKKLACLKWATRPQLTMTLCYLMNRPLTLPWEDIKVLELSISIVQSPLDLSWQSMSANIYPIIHKCLPPTKLDSFSRIHKESNLWSWGKFLAVEQGSLIPDSWRRVELECGWEPFWTPFPQATKAG